MAIPRREIRERRLRDNYAKLDVDQRGKLGYGSINKGEELLKKAEKAPPMKQPPIGKREPTTTFGVKKEAEGIEEGDVQRGGPHKGMHPIIERKGVGGLAGLKASVRGKRGY